MNRFLCNRRRLSRPQATKKDYTQLLDKLVGVRLLEWWAARLASSTRRRFIEESVNDGAAERRIPHGRDCSREPRHTLVAIAQPDRRERTFQASLRQDVDKIVELEAKIKKVDQREETWAAATNLSWRSD
jgi:hypothetical protein